MLESTGVQFPAGRARIDLLEPKNGEHVWTTIVAYRVTPDQARQAHAGETPIHLDMENIATVHTGCVICQRPFSQRESYRKCKGEPDG